MRDILSEKGPKCYAPETVEARKTASYRAFSEELQPDLMHIQTLTNSVGILQHATYTVPNYHHGYCLDDNARALMLAGMHLHLRRSATTRDLAKTYLAYIQYMQKTDGQFRNFLSFDHQFLDEVGTEDSYGRAIWGLGNFLKFHPRDPFASLAREMLKRAVPHCTNLRSARAIAYTILGLADYCRSIDRADEQMLSYLQGLATFLTKEFKACRQETWVWFEEVLSYDNAIIPVGLFRAANLLNDTEMGCIAECSSKFLDEITFGENGHFSPVGNEGWYPKGGRRARFGQQPVEVPSTILLYKYLYERTLDPIYSERAQDTFHWFFGKNDLSVPMYDPDSKGCSDGLDKHGANGNQGAESTISFWQAYFYLYHDLY